MVYNNPFFFLSNLLLVRHNFVVICLFRCLCYSGFSTNELGTCSAVGRTSGDILNFGLTVTHDPDYTGKHTRNLHVMIIIW